YRPPGVWLRRGRARPPHQQTDYRQELFTKRGQARIPATTESMSGKAVFGRARLLPSRGWGGRGSCRAGFASENGSAGGSPSLFRTVSEPDRGTGVSCERTPSREG